MKKKKFLIALFSMLTVFNMHANAIPVLIPLHVGYVDPDDGNRGRHRSPALAPSVTIEDNILTFLSSCDGNTLRIVDEDGFVVYSTTIPEGCDQIELPSYLNGEYEIQLIRGNFCFCGYIEL